MDTIFDGIHQEMGIFQPGDLLVYQRVSTILSTEMLLGHGTCKDRSVSFFHEADIGARFHISEYRVKCLCHLNIVVIQSTDL